jgi:ubiquinone/menaquinone biosynthesis C-methylase UbiE
MSLFLARKGLEVTGVDSSPHAVHEARQKAERNHLRGRFEARRADAKSLPFQDGEFDAVIAFHSLHHADDVQSVLNEMYRVCRRGGTILVSDFNQQGQKACDHERDGGRLLSRLRLRLPRTRDWRRGSQRSST